MIYYYNKTMKLEYDLAKEQLNLRKHDISLARFVDLDWDTARVFKDERTDYGEARYVAAAELANRLCIACFTLRGDVFRAISLRKANKQEYRSYHDSEK